MKNCLIVVDYQNDFVSGSLGSDWARSLEGKIAEKIAAYRASDDQVVFTYDTHTPDYLSTQEGKKLPVEHCIRDTEGHRLYGLVDKARLPEDKCFYKPAFGSGELYSYLRENPFNKIELIGVVTNICVISNAVLCKTAQPETEVQVDAGCCAAVTKEIHDKALDVMESFQITITNREA